MLLIAVSSSYTWWAVLCNLTMPIGMRSWLHPFPGCPRLCACRQVPAFEVFPHHRPMEIGFEEPVLHDTVFLAFCFRMGAGELGCVTCCRRSCGVWQ